MLQDVDVVLLKNDIAGQATAQRHKHGEADGADEVELVFARGEHTRRRRHDDGDHFERNGDRDHLFAQGHRVGSVCSNCQDGWTHGWSPFTMRLRCEPAVHLPCAPTPAPSMRSGACAYQS